MDGQDGFEFKPGTDAKVSEPLKVLFSAPVGAVLRELEASGMYGLLPRMAAHSVAGIGPVLSQSFCERVNSCAAIVVTDKNTSLSDEELSALVVLRMNKKLFSSLANLSDTQKYS